MTPAARPFGFWKATALVVGGMIGAGIFILPAQLAPFGATGAVAWPIAIAGALILSWVIAGLSAARPESPGLLPITGEVLGPLLGVLNGWAYWVTVWTTVAVLGTSAASYLAPFVPAIGMSPARIAAASIAIVCIMTLANLAGARMVGAIQLVTTLLKLLPLVVIVGLLAVFAATGGAQWRAHPHAGFDPTSLSSAVNLAFFALLGFECAGIAAARVQNPARNVPRATMVGVAVTGLLYLLVCSGIVYALPADRLAASGAPMALFMESYVGRWAGLAVAGFAAIAAIGCLNGWVLLQGEVPQGMAQARLLPAWLGRTDHRDVPRQAIILSSGLATILLLSSMSRSTADLFDLMLRLTTTTALFTYIAFCVVALILRVRRVAAVMGIAFSIWVIVGAGMEAGVLSLLLMLTAVPLYFLRPSEIVPTT